MEEFFSIEYVRKELINKLKDKGFSSEEIISVCDEMYEKYKTPYPTIDV